MRKLVAQAKLSTATLTFDTDPIMEPTPTMPESNNENSVETLTAELKALEQSLPQMSKDNAGKVTKDLIIVQNRLYAQLESLSWLQRRLATKHQLPPLRGWAASPDVLLHLHTHIMSTQPRLIVELGSGASTLVVADALVQNGKGKLVSIEHSEFYAGQTLHSLKAAQLQDCVELRVGDLETWKGVHLNPEESEKPSRWYPVRLLRELGPVDLLWVDGPPGATCPYARYPAMPTLVERLSANSEVWMDDTIRREEKDICERWAEDYGFEVEYYELEKGLARLAHPQGEGVAKRTPSLAVSSVHEAESLEAELGLDFSLPDARQK